MLTHKGTKIIETERLILRRFQFKDVDSMFKNWANDVEVTKFLTWKPHGDIAISKSVGEQWIKEYEYKFTYHWVIETKESKELIGDIAVVSLDERINCCEIGYCIGSKYWRRGITTEALKEVINYLFSEIGMNRIMARHNVENIASGKVMIKSNMKYEGTSRQSALTNDGKLCDIASYAILKEDWISKI